MRAAHWAACLLLLLVTVVALACSGGTSGDAGTASGESQTVPIVTPSEPSLGGASAAVPTQAFARTGKIDATPSSSPSPVAEPSATPEPTPTPVPVSSPTLPGVPPPRNVRGLPVPLVQAKAAVVIDADSGAVLFDKDAHTPLPPASTTKIVTALVALERGNLDEEIEVKLDPARTYWGSVMGLRDGDRFTLRDLLYGLMLPSGNDAAYVIATHIAGSERDFADLMNARMRSLGLVENTFNNASGLGRPPVGNVVSAYDLAQVSRVAMTNLEFVKLASARAWTARGSRVIGLGNLNELVFRYPGADGVKIGWGGASAGNTIVGSAVRNGHRVIVVLLNTPDRAGESAALLNWVFTGFAWDTPAQ
jgi:serine-type D-Ala-D-Ala carboxypeptidase (penicillin-binding protein 5/6)